MASDRAALEAFFETNDIPTQGQYMEFIVSAPNIVDDYQSAPAFVIAASLGIPSADVLTGNSVPIPFLPAQGAGLAIFIEHMQVEVIFNTTPYATNTTVTLINDSGNVLQKAVSTVLAVSGSAILRDNVLPFYTAGSRQIIANDGVSFQVLTGNPTAGDSDIVVHAQFTVMSV